jgi:hypothetical protein
MGWMPAPDGIVMCQSDVGENVTGRRRHPWMTLPLWGWISQSGVLIVAEI